MIFKNNLSDVKLPPVRLRPFACLCLPRHLPRQEDDHGSGTRLRSQSDKRNLGTLVYFSGPESLFCTILETF